MSATVETEPQMAAATSKIHRACYFLLLRLEALAGLGSTGGMGGWLMG